MRKVYIENTMVPSMVVPITPRIREYDNEFGVAARERYRRSTEANFAKLRREELLEIAERHTKRNFVSRFLEWFNDGGVGYGAQFSKSYIEYQVAKELLKPGRYTGPHF
jgi:hypothetical protein